MVKDPKALRNSNSDRNALQLLLCKVFTDLANMDWAQDNGIYWWTNTESFVSSYNLYFNGNIIGGNY